MTDEILNILHLEDNPNDAQLIALRLIRDGVHARIQVASTAEAFEAGLAGPLPDLILADYGLPSYDGVRALALAQQKAPLVPFIFVTGEMGEELAIQTLKQGAVDYVLKDHLNPLARAVRLAVARRAENEFRAIVESAPEPMVMVNNTGQIVLVNNQLLQLFGYARAELVGRRLDHLLPNRPDGRPQPLAEFFLPPLDKHLGADFDLFGRRKDGGTFPLEISLSTMLTKDGPLVSAALHDVTERRQFEQALREKNQELQNALLAKDRFLASMSHELRTPLNAIIGFTGTLLMRLPGPLTPDQEKQLLTVRTGARHLLALINDLLDVAKIDAGKVELHLETVDGQDVLSEVAATLAPLAANKNLRLELELPATPTWLQTDRRALSQILVNLANNAIKFTETGQVRLTLTQTAGQTTFGVIDTGPGLTTEEQTRLFQAFEQVGNAATRRQEGTGLGLYLSQKLAALLGGHVEVISVLGEGSVFRLVIG